MTTQSEFEKASNEIQNLKNRPSNESLLKLYAYFKQSKEGDVKGSRPGMLDLKGRKKYDAWAELKGVSSEVAMREYVSLVQKLLKEDNS